MTTPSPQPQNDWQADFCDCMLPPVVCGALWWKTCFCPCIVVADNAIRGELKKENSNGESLARSCPSFGEADSWDQVCRLHAFLCFCGIAGAVCLSPIWAGLPLLSTLSYRQELRKKYGLKEICCCCGTIGTGGIGDIVSELMCCPCGIAQDALEIQAHAK